MNIISNELFLQDLLELTKQIKKRPELYTGERSLTKLYYLLKGFAHAYHCLDAEKKTFDFYPGFQAWIQNREGIKTTQQWYKILLFYSTSESEALDLFFERLEEFYNTIL